jgi:hypothetical protein
MDPSPLLLHRVRGPADRCRARFIAERQFYENPADPYGRNHMFMPFDYRIGTIFTESDEVYEVGGSDEYGFSEPVFLAAKNLYRPRREEVEKLETYVHDVLMGRLQNPETFALRASLYWKERTPSSPWGHWTEERSKESYRTYNYPTRRTSTTPSIGSGSCTA